MIIFYNSPYIRLIHKVYQTEATGPSSGAETGDKIKSQDEKKYK
jgi:hypothetical protein